MGKMIYKELNVILSSYTGLIAIVAFYGIVTLFLWVLPGQTFLDYGYACLLYTSPSPRDLSTSRMPSSA